MDNQSGGRPSSKGSMGMFWGLLAFGAILIYVSGWSLVWGGQLFLGSGDISFQNNSLLIRFNLHYYGITLAPRFFDSPIVSYLLGGFGVGAAIAAFSELRSSSAEYAGKS